MMYGMQHALALLAAAGGSPATPFLVGLGAALFAAILLARWRRIAAERRAAEGSGAESAPTLSTSRFWSLVEEAKVAAGPDPQHRPAALQRLLKELDPDDIARFDARYREVRSKGATDALRTAAHLIRGGADEVTFGLVRDWLISEGRDVYERARKDPDSIAALGAREVTSLEPYGYAAKRAYKARANAQLAGTERAEPHSTRAPEWDRAAAAAALPGLAQIYRG